MRSLLAPILCLSLVGCAWLNEPIGPPPPGFEEIEPGDPIEDDDIIIDDPRETKGGLFTELLVLGGSIVGLGGVTLLGKKVATSVKSKRKLRAKRSDVTR